MIISGNNEKGLANSLYKIYPYAEFYSKTAGIDLCKKDHQYEFAHKCLQHDVIINCAALWKFQQTTLLDTIYKVCVEKKHNPHIINVGSTTDRVKNGKPWLYNAEKKALRDYSNTLSLGGVWDEKPKVSYISFGTLSNNQSKHPDRKTLDIDEAASYVKWLIDQPRYVNINEISVDPMQSVRWYE